MDKVSKIVAETQKQTLEDVKHAEEVARLGEELQQKIETVLALSEEATEAAETVAAAIEEQTASSQEITADANNLFEQ